ncbi:MAG: hypothetical protein LBN00_11035 [Oscillospiraceae bacterium]|jgi:hypothetical protein|nr:hypothetical protein [Oscillospiraceae bacterium]
MSNPLETLLAAYEALVDEQRKLLDAEDYDALILSLDRSDAVRYELEGVRQAGEPVTPELREIALRVREKVTEQQRLLAERMRELGAENAKRAITRRGIAAYNPLPLGEADAYDKKA